MLSRNLKRVLTWVALAAAAVISFAPRAASAAILPACENHPLTQMPVEWLAVAAAAAQLDACAGSDGAADAAMMDDVDGGDPRVAAMCDDRGASVIAPPRVLPVVDARIDAPSSCGAEASGPSCAPAPDDGSAALTGFALAEQGMLSGVDLVPPAPSELGPPFSMVDGSPLPGVKRGIEHPPR
jgi:hypothetical protein